MCVCACVCLCTCWENTALAHGVPSRGSDHTLCCSLSPTHTRRPWHPTQAPPRGRSCLSHITPADLHACCVACGESRASAACPRPGRLGASLTQGLFCCETNKGLAQASSGSSPTGLFIVCWFKSEVGARVSAHLGDDCRTATSRQQRHSDSKRRSRPQVRTCRAQGPRRAQGTHTAEKIVQIGELGSAFACAPCRVDALHHLLSHTPVA